MRQGRFNEEQMVAMLHEADRTSIPEAAKAQGQRGHELLVAPALRTS